MTTKATVPKTKCPVTGKDAKCGVDDLAVALRSMQAELKSMQADLKKFAASMEKLWHGADLEYYATIAKQLGGVPDTLEKVQALLKSVLADRTEGHDAINKLQGEVKEIKAWQTLHEASAHPGSTSGSIKP
jgi:hypothetical protein